MKFPNHTILFAAPDDSISESVAKQYTKHMNFSKENVKIYRSDGQILIRAIKDIE